MTALSGEKTLAELSAEFGVHPTMIRIGLVRLTQLGRGPS
jgi:DNA-binding transcriptional regulator PaaX